jgi:endoglucanase
MINKTRTNFAKLLAAIGFSILFYFFGFAPVYAAPAVEIWWPTQDSELHGTQPFKGLLQGTDVNQYTMYWQVDGGNLVKMDTNYTDYPHKEALVDVSGWNWKGTGPYVINFVTKDANGNVLAQTTRTIYTGPKTTTTSVVSTTTVVPTATVTQTSTSISGATLYTAVKAPNTSPSLSSRNGKLTAIVVSPTTTTTVTSPTVTSPTVTSPTVTSSSNPLAGKTLYVDPNSQAAAAVKSASPTDAEYLKKISTSPTAVWLGGWYTDSQLKDKITSVLNGAKATNSTPTFVLYNIPIRDCGSYSAGGANNPEGYKSWINIIAQTIGSNSAVLILEPDALPQSNCLSSTDLATRMSLITYAVDTLKANANTAVYLDAGHSRWKSVDEISSLLNKAGIAKANGFSLNTSNYEYTTNEINYGTQVSAKVGNKHFIVDTSRNGNGSNGEWCNPSGRALGEKPTTTTGNSLVDAFLWIKAPGESDGQCNGGPSAGTWWTSYALGLAKLAHW